MRLLPAVVAWACLSGACGWRAADEQVLTRFFEQSRVYDKTRLAPIASVEFNPRVDGVVERFTIVDRADRVLGDRLSRQLTVRADVRSAGGRVNQQTLVVTLEQREGAWLVTAFR